MKIYDDKKTRCKVCGKATDNTVYIIKEMLNNTKEEFEYLECPHCKSMQIIDIPEDIPGAFELALNKIGQTWRGKTKIAFLLTDSPCHGKEFII